MTSKLWQLETKSADDPEKTHLLVAHGDVLQVPPSALCAAISVTLILTKSRQILQAVILASASTSAADALSAHRALSLSTGQLRRLKS